MLRYMMAQGVTQVPENMLQVNKQQLWRRNLSRLLRRIMQMMQTMYQIKVFVIFICKLLLVSKKQRTKQRDIRNIKLD